MSETAKRQIVGKVTPSERDEIQTLFERKNSLKELFMIVAPDNTALYERVVADMAETKRKFDQWWSDRSKEYNWESSPTGSWHIDFETCEISFLQAECNCSDCENTKSCNKE